MKLKKLLITACVAMVGLGMASCGASKPTKPDNPGDPGNSESGNQGGETGGETTGGETGGQTGGQPGQTVTVGDVNILSSEGLNEAAYVEFDAVAGANSYEVYDNNTKLDEKGFYIQTLENGTMRADLFGLTKGEHTIKIAAVGGSNTNSSACKVTVGEYDRSGYAHFKSNVGVGAYNNDGTLKDNAIVLYVTDANKNTVELTYDGITVIGIGNILNTAGKKCGEAGHENDCKKVSDGKTIYAPGNDNQGILQRLATNNIPLVIRFVGCVSDSGLYQQGTFNMTSNGGYGLINGLTKYNSNDFGGTVGDNGHMARMKSAKDVTIEGVGNDAIIDGWGIHFMCESAAPELGKSFEVRNLTFINTPEDAIGMEGVETESTMTLTAPVERCWVHNNSFLCPNIGSPAESDKSEGDGSCDFKRGNYFTLSYNYFEKCHKTNLMGSSKTSVQYHITFHHNVWNQCGGRQPMVRNSNIHMYNNYFIGSTDYVTSIRANSYIFSENNYYLGCKNPVSNGGEGGVSAFKSYNDVMVANYEDYEATVVTNRDTKVSSGCKFANFDTNPEVFYYVPGIGDNEGHSDCLMTDASTARIACIQLAGSLYRTAVNKTMLSTNVDITNVAASATIALEGETETLSIAKAKGILKVFTLKSPAEVTFTASSTSGLNPGYIVKLDGTYVCKSGDKNVVIEEPGVYVVFAGQYDPSGKNSKEATAEIVFSKYNSAEADGKSLAKYEAAANAIGTVAYTTESINKIKAAQAAYDSLKTELKNQITTPYSTVEQAYNTYMNLGISQVEAAIVAIGAVNANSSSAIIRARDLYTTLLINCPDAVVSNKNVLEAAEASFQGFALSATVDAINAIGNVTLNSEAAIINARKLYDGLTESQRSQVTNLNALTAAEAKLVDLKATNAVDTLIAGCDMTSIDAMNNVIDEYNNLTASQKALVADMATYYNIVIARVNALINAIGTVTAQSKPEIVAARNAYDALTEAQKTTVGAEQLKKLTDAEAAISSLIVKYIYTKDLTTISDTKYIDDAIACNIGEFSSGIAIIRKSKGNDVTINAVNGAAKATITINGACLDSSDPKDVAITVKYADGTSEVKTVTTAKSKAYSNMTLELDGKIISSVVINGIDSKQLGIKTISIEFEK